MKQLTRIVILIALGCATYARPASQKPAIPKPAEQVHTEPPKPRLEESQENTPGQSTIQAVLGTANVDTLIRETIAEASRRLSYSFILTEASFDELRRRHAEDAAAKLRPLENQRIEGTENFDDAIRTKLGRSWHKNFRGGDITQIAKTTLIANDDFVKQIQLLILGSRAPSHGDVKVWVQVNFARFLSGYIIHLEATSENKNQIVLKTEGLDEYLKKMEKKCGELPCAGIPPCCGEECDPCKKP